VHEIATSDTFGGFSDELRARSLVRDLHLVQIQFFAGRLLDRTLVLALASVPKGQDKPAHTDRASLAMPGGGDEASRLNPFQAHATSSVTHARGLFVTETLPHCQVRPNGAAAARPVFVE